MTEKRPDETDDYRNRSGNNSLPAETINTENIEMKEVDISDDAPIIIDSNKKSIFDSIIGLICGFKRNELLNNEELEKQNELDSQRRVEGFYSLNQTKFQTFVLNMNLVIIVSIASGFLTFFSIPPDQFIFQNIRYNQSLPKSF